MRLLRVFPRRTSMTPTDDYAFIGDPPMEGFRPDEADEVHISVTFTWDKQEGERLADAWAQYYPAVYLGGPAYVSPCGSFTPRRYVKTGVTFTSRGCNNKCPWCLVPHREGKIQLLEIQLGYIVEDNNLLQTGRDHMAKVFSMLKQTGRAVTLSGGLDSRLLDDWVAEELKQLKIKEVFLAADTAVALAPLSEAVKRLPFLSRRQLRCYVMIAYDSETVEKASKRLAAVWRIGCLPFAQLYQPEDEWIEYSKEWKDLARLWSRPAAMISNHGRESALESGQHE